ncbi:MAG: lytic transglycosylase domain-containing protein [Acidobacteria bacterium]|nr:lytic transglycosylase domain-containing protein [Acidobacteriota bacterium]
MKRKLKEPHSPIKIVIISIIILCFCGSTLLAEKGKNYIYRTKDGKLLLTDRPHSSEYAQLLKTFESRKEQFYTQYGNYYHEKYDSLVRKYSNRNGLDPDLVHAVIQVESGYDYTAVSPAGAKGLMQLVDSTADSLGVQNVYSPEENIRGGTEYLSKMLSRYNGNLTLALAAYNAGPTNVDRYKGVPPFSETKRYIQKIRNILGGREISTSNYKTVPLKDKPAPKLQLEKRDGKYVIVSKPVRK